MADLGSLFVNLGLESAQFIAGMKKAAAQSEATNKAISRAMDGAKTAVTGLLAVMSVDAFVSAARAAFDYADSIVDLADRTGATTKSIQELRYAAQMTGADFASADGALEKFAKNLGTAQSGGKAMGEVFKALALRPAISTKHCARPSTASASCRPFRSEMQRRSRCLANRRAP